MKKTVIQVAMATMCLGVSAEEIENTSLHHRMSSHSRAAVTASGSIIGVPEMLPYTDVTAAGFTARWTEVEGAAGYVLQSFLFHTASQDESYNLLDTSFELFDAGYSLTTDSPLTYKQLGYSIGLDYIVERSGWTCSMPALANGCLGLDNSRAYNGQYGELTSPAYNLGSTDGSVSVMIRCFGEGVTRLSAVLTDVSDSDGTSTATVLDVVTIDVTDAWDYHALTLTGASDSAIVTLRADDGSGRLWINELQVSVRLSEGATVKVPYTTLVGDDITGCSAVVSTPDRTDDDTFACRVAAYADSATGRSADAVMSDFSAEAFLPTESAVDYDETDEPIATVTTVDCCSDVRVAVTADGVRIEADCPTAVTVYNTAGRVVYASAAAAVHDVTLVGGFYVACAGSSTLKFVR